MIVIRWTQPFELEISAHPVELRGVMTQIRAVASGQMPRTVVAADQAADARPYSRCLQRLTVNNGAGPTKVSVEGDAVEVTGSACHLAMFASYFDLADESPVSPIRYHHHFEYFEGDDRMVPDSVPLVISVA